MASVAAFTPATREGLAQLPIERLVELVIQLSGVIRAQDQAITEIADQRDAALLLNELCHY
jgi:hypothetical protein